MDLPAAQQAYLRLERMIVTLELAPGSATTEGALIDQTGIGRTPLREAIQRLSWEGLLDIRPRTGIVVASLNPADWINVVDARRGLEITLARSAARFLTHEAAERFHQASLAMQKAVITGNVLAFLDADKMLDTAVVAAGDNAFAARAVTPLQAHSRRFWFRYQNDAELADAAQAHLAVLTSILDGHPQAAEAATDTLMNLLRKQAMAVLAR